VNVVPEVVATDEAIIDAPPMEVYKAILNEYAGVTHWWMPYIEHKPKGDIAIGHEGAICEKIAHGRGMRVKFSEKITKIVKGKSIEVEQSGDFIGTGTWTFEPIDGKTRIQFRVNVRTNKLIFSLIAPFIRDIGKPHSESMQKGFNALNSYLSKK
jgi:uncharacterized protein YndB with AHSA1/START domain